MTSKTRTRWAYTEEFKREAVALITEQGYKIAQAARSLDIGANLLGRWKHQFEAQATGVRLRADERQELKRLHKEVRQLRLEKEILKKAGRSLTSVDCSGFSAVPTMTGETALQGDPAEGVVLAAVDEGAVQSLPG